MQAINSISIPMFPTVIPTISPTDKLEVGGVVGVGSVPDGWHW